MSQYYIPSLYIVHLKGALSSGEAVGILRRFLFWSGGA